MMTVVPERMGLQANGTGRNIPSLSNDLRLFTDYTKQPLRIKDFTGTQDSCVFYICESYGIQMLKILYTSLCIIFAINGKTHIIYFFSLYCKKTK